MLPEMATWKFSSKLTHVLRNTYIKDKFLASSILYSHGAYKAAKEWQSLFQLSFTLELTTAVKASNVLYVQCGNIIFPNETVKATYKFLIAKFCQYLRHFD